MMYAKKAQTAIWVSLVIIGMIVAGVGAFVLMGSKAPPVQQTGLGGGVGAVVPPVPGGSSTPACAQNPAYSYSGADVFSSALMSGTNQIKLNDNRPVSSLANPTAGQALKFWLENTTGAMCDLVDAGLVQCGANSVQGKCYLNGTPTLAVIDTTGAGTTLTDGCASGNNLSLSANQLKNIRIDYTETKNKPSMPFGGCVAVEHPTRLSSLSLTGNAAKDEKGALGDPCPYTWTYSVGNVANTVKKYYVPKGYDTDAKGLTKAINLQITSGATAPTSDFYNRVTFQPAYYYLANDGTYDLAIEQQKNDLTTKTYGTGYNFKFCYSP